jgi:NAD+ diphosphatase
MIQDIGWNRFHCEYKKKDPNDGSVILCYYKNKILLSNNENKILPKYGELKNNRVIQKEMLVYLFSIEETEYYLLNADLEYIDEKFTYYNVREVREFTSLEECFTVSTGYQLFIWYRDNKYCGRCGHELQRDEKERMLFCPDCGNMVYPKIAPAVIVGIIDKDRIVMTKYADREYKKYSLVAGFCEIGEAAEDTVRREVMEEVGLRVRNIRYYKSQPWGFDSNLLLGFFADLDGDDKITREESELAVAEWIERKDTDGMNDGISLTREMIDTFCKNNVRN